MITPSVKSHWLTLAKLRRGQRQNTAPYALNEAGKLPVHVVSHCQCLATVGPDVGDLHSGFHRQRCTIDALEKFRKTATMATEVGERPMAVSLDIANVFNSLL